MPNRLAKHSDGTQAGVSLAETLIVLAIVSIMTAVAIPQMVAQRRLMRSTHVSREIVTQMRYARQQAMSLRQAYTFQYNNNTKTIRIIGPIPRGTAALNDALYPNNTGSSVLSTVTLAQSGLFAFELKEGIPTTSTGLPAGHPTIPTGPLPDGVSKTTLTSGMLNITFQPDGSVIDGTTGAPSNKALFYFNNKIAADTSTAISVLGSSGRVKTWRYSSSGNKFIE